MATGRRRGGYRCLKPRRPVPTRAARSATGSARTRTAASSIASGMPSSRRQSRMACGRSAGVSVNPLTAAAARCANSSTASPASASVMAVSVPGTHNGPSLSTSSPGTCSGCLLVARILTALVSRSTVAANSAQAAARCSQVSRTSSSCLPLSSSSTASRAAACARRGLPSAPAACARFRPRRSATVSQSSSGSVRQDSSTRQLPSAQSTPAGGAQRETGLPRHRPGPGRDGDEPRAPSSRARPAGRARCSGRRNRRHRRATASGAASRRNCRSRPANSCAPHVVAVPPPRSSPPHYHSPQGRGLLHLRKIKIARRDFHTTTAFSDVSALVLIAMTKATIHGKRHEVMRIAATPPR